VATTAAETLQLDLPHAVALRAHATLALREGDSERAAALAVEAMRRATREATTGPKELRSGRFAPARKTAAE